MDWETVENEIAEIEGNRLVLEKLVELLKAHNALAFVGAGASAEIWPLWGAFLEGFIREPGFGRFVLHAHGRHDRADSMILTLDDYRRAYGYGPFIRMLNDVFASESLVMVGFGMADPYIKQLFNNIQADFKQGPLRHVALVGLDDKETGAAGLIRERAEMVFGARVLFYPSKDRHSTLTRWLEALAERFGDAPDGSRNEPPRTLLAPSGQGKSVSDMYVHQPTHDERFSGRKRDFETLNRWACDSATRIVAVTGIGGQGKTALAGRWLSNERDDRIKHLPVFFWSFYENMDTQACLRAITDFLLPAFPNENPPRIEPFFFIPKAVEQVPSILVFDGLEVKQNDSPEESRGRFDDPLLEQFLRQWLKYSREGVVLLTSRFRFPQLSQYLGAGFHQLHLTRLDANEGSFLLENLGVRGGPELLARYVKYLDGHPLGLRILASAVKRDCLGDLEQFECRDILDMANHSSGLGQKLHRLLRFYETRLEKGQKELLGIISLFKHPVETASFVNLLGCMKTLENTPLAGADRAEIERRLNLLANNFLVEKTRTGIATHPVIRDFFRGGLEVPGARQEVADYLNSRPANKWPKSLDEVRDLVEAVQLLCDEGDIKAAINLYHSRLSGGWYEFNVFRDMPALTEGLECALAFVGDKKRRKKLEIDIGIGEVAFRYSGLSLHNYLLGNPGQALE